MQVHHALCVLEVVYGMIKLYTFIVSFGISTRNGLFEKCNFNESAFQYQNANVYWKKDSAVLFDWLEKQSKKSMSNVQIKYLPPQNLNDKFEGMTYLAFQDKTYMKAKFKAGIIEGKIQLYDRQKKLRAIGFYKNGLPNGPFWIFDDLQFAQVHFEKGNISEYIY